ncbi:MAG: bifunctional 3,4-dihydroxy-2-butanone-4-phosphate synthase/GTP cyclohydrolase II [Planctomycetes bacterium]|nr:bifunctional 3,4-dihydroxy-2-butanone-4-phosphate synthase/GTP cyclohydrolase II [Planctomycetota bacterium]
MTDFREIPEILQALARGEMIILTDDEDRENEGDLVIAAEHVTTEKLAFIARHTPGLICLPMSEEKADALELPLMVTKNQDKKQTAYTVTIDARRGITTGISAHDRAFTARLAASRTALPEDFVRPGHVLPLRARDGGVLVRTGHTEGSVDLMRLAGLPHVALISELCNDDGTMMRLPNILDFSRKHGIKITSIAKVIEYRSRREKLIELDSTVCVPTHFGEFWAHLFASKISGEEHIAFTRGIKYDEASKSFPFVDEPVLTRVHSECLTGDVFGSLRCDCGSQLQAALRMVSEAERGVVLYMRQEGRGIGLKMKMRAYHLQDSGLDTVEANEQLGFLADHRDYGMGAQILKELGIRKLRLLTNNPRKYKALSGYELEIVERVPLEIVPNDKNQKYLKTKKDKLGHWLEQV